MADVRCECGALMRWAYTEGGKRTPLSVATEERRMVVLRDAPDGSPVVGIRTTYVNHFVDCPLRDKFRKKK